jgi:hypothetical protein
MQHVWVFFLLPNVETSVCSRFRLNENAPRRTLSGDPGIAAFSRSFARVACNIRSVASNRGEEVFAPLEF